MCRTQRDRRNLGPIAPLAEERQYKRLHEDGAEEEAEEVARAVGPGFFFAACS